MYYIYLSIIFFLASSSSLSYPTFLNHPSFFFIYTIVYNIYISHIIFFLQSHSYLLSESINMYYIYFCIIYNFLLSPFNPDSSLFIVTSLFYIFIFIQYSTSSFNPIFFSYPSFCIIYISVLYISITYPLPFPSIPFSSRIYRSVLYIIITYPLSFPSVPSSFLFHYFFIHCHLLP
jgi:hypothetical protein